MTEMQFERKTSHKTSRTQRISLRDIKSPIVNSIIRLGSGRHKLACFVYVILRRK